MLDLIFVYGTLRRTTNTQMYRHFIAHNADFLGVATMQGRIYKIHHYPGVVLSDDPDDIVHGELYRLRGAETLLPAIDEYEGCSDDFPKPTRFIRDVVEVNLTEHGSHDAWVYLYNRDPVAKGWMWIESGDYMDVFEPSEA